MEVNEMDEECVISYKPLKNKDFLMKKKINEIYRFTSINVNGMNPKNIEKFECVKKLH